MKVQVQRWGRALAVRLPEKLVADLGLRAGDDIPVEVEERRLSAIAAARTTDQILADLARPQGAKGL